MQICQKLMRHFASVTGMLGSEMSGLAVIFLGAFETVLLELDELVHPGYHDGCTLR